jgi:transposase InsO family protein
LESLDVGLREEDVSGFASTFAQHAFDRLAEDIQTGVTVAVYDIDRVRGFLDSVDDTYDRTLVALEGTPPPSSERCDCAEDPAYALPGISQGIEVLYRPPRFGPLKQKESHSGWGCWRLIQ